MYKATSIFFILLLMLLAQTSRAWTVDFSRRQVPGSTTPLTNTDEVSNPGALTVNTVHQSKDVKDRQEVVILNTQKGFIPSSVRLHKGLHYKIHVVNVNEDKRNVSFIMDGFNQHSATYYGQIKSFDVDPTKEGVFEYECPETTAMGKVVVFGPGKTVSPAPAQTQPDIERNVSSEQ